MSDDREHRDPCRAILSRDTTADAEQRQLEIWRCLTTIEKTEIVEGACRAARALAFAGLRERHPGASERMLVALYAELTLGSTLARQVYPDVLGPPE